MSICIGIDLGGTKIAGAAYDTCSQRIIYHEVIATDRRHGSDGVIQQMITLVRSVSTNIAHAEITGVGVGMPAVLDYEAGHTLILPNIPGKWINKPVVLPMCEALGLPVYLINDARAFILAEATIGAGKGYSIVAGITLGTGIGGGIVIDGKLLLGMNGGAGEFGHISIDLNGLPDGTGTPGGLESLGSGPAIAAAGAKAVIQGVNTRIGEIVDYDLNAITPRVIAQAADEGDEVARDILQRAGRAIGAGIAIMLTVLNPHALVIGGGVAQLGERIMGPMRAALPMYNGTGAVENLTIFPATLSDPGCIGAALWAKQQEEV